MTQPPRSGSVSPPTDVPVPYPALWLRADVARALSPAMVDAVTAHHLGCEPTVDVSTRIARIQTSYASLDRPTPPTWYLVLIAEGNLCVVPLIDPAADRAFLAAELRAGGVPLPNFIPALERPDQACVTAGAIVHTT